MDRAKTLIHTAGTHESPWRSVASGTLFLGTAESAIWGHLAQARVIWRAGLPMTEIELNDWSARLSIAVAVSLRDLFSRSEPLAAIDLGCFPWHGRIELSALTLRGTQTDPELLNPNEVAAWDYYNFAEHLPSWRIVALLGHEMREAYRAAGDSEREPTVEVFLRACTTAVGSPQVAAALPENPQIRFTVCHPDTGVVLRPLEQS